MRQTQGELREAKTYAHNLEGDLARAEDLLARSHTEIQDAAVANEKDKEHAAEEIRQLQASLAQSQEETASYSARLAKVEAQVTDELDQARDRECHALSEAEVLPMLASH